MDRGGPRQPEILVFFVKDGTGQLGKAGERRDLAGRQSAPMIIIKLRRCMRSPEGTCGRSPRPEIVRTSLTENAAPERRHNCRAVVRTLCFAA